MILVDDGSRKQGMSIPLRGSPISWVRSPHLRRAVGSSLIDLLLLEVSALIVVSYCFRGVTSTCDGFMHLSKIKILLDNLRGHGYFPRWNPYWYFGVPMWRIYSPLSYYIMAFLGWVFNLSIPDIANLWAYIVFSISALSTYLLARELGVRRLGCFASGILFLTSANILIYWGIGSYPNITGVAFSPMALLLFLRAVRKKDAVNMLAAGLAFSLVILTYFMNAVILFIFIACISIILILQEPSLLYISRGPREPPRYTLILPKILLSIVLIAFVLSSWWILPFLTMYMSARTIPIGTGVDGTLGSLTDQIVKILGFYPNLYSPGIGHIALAMIGCILILKFESKARVVIAPMCFFVAFVFSLTPWLHIPTGPLYWWRFSSYLSLFASICGGFLIDHLRKLGVEFLDQNLSPSLKKRRIVKVYPLFLSALVLSVAVYPVLASREIVFPGYDISKVPEEIVFLESRSRSGERVGIDGGYGFNLYTRIPQSGGGDVYYVYMVNEFAYTFWYYIFERRNYTCLQYFARNYNVRWLIGLNMPGLNQEAPELPYEVAGFNSSFAELVGSSSALILFIGEYSEYANLFIAVAFANPQDIILAYGGETLEGYSLQDLEAFDAIYLSGLRFERQENSDAISSLLLEYSEAGGGIILDTGVLPYGGELENIPDPFPVEQTAIYDRSYLMLSGEPSHNVTKDIDFTNFRTTEPYAISYAKALKENASALVYDEDRPVVAYWERGSGRVLWMGLRLPYLVALHQGVDEARFLVNILRFSASTKPEYGKNYLISFECPVQEEILVTVENATTEDALWVKMSYYPGWRAELQGQDRTPLRIFQAGPNMMIVFPKKNGDYTVRFHFDKTLDVQIGEVVSQIGAATFLILIIYTLIKGRLKTSRKPPPTAQPTTLTEN